MKYARQFPPEFVRRILRRRATTPVSASRAPAFPRLEAVSRLNSPIAVSEEPKANSATSAANLSSRGAVLPQPATAGARAPTDSDEHFREFFAHRTVIASHADGIHK